METYYCQRIVEAILSSHMAVLPPKPVVGAVGSLSEEAMTALPSRARRLHWAHGTQQERRQALRQALH